MGTEAAVVDDAGNVEDTDETDDATAEPAEPAVADNTAAADNVNQVGTGNTDGAFEPGSSSPFRPDGSLKWDSVAAYGRHWATVISNERAEAQKRRDE